MKYRLLFISLLSLLIASVSFNMIHLESLAVVEAAIKTESKVYRIVVNQLWDRINQLENEGA